MQLYVVVRVYGPTHMNLVRFPLDNAAQDNSKILKLLHPSLLRYAFGVGAHLPRQSLAWKRL